MLRLMTVVVLTLAVAFTGCAMLGLGPKEEDQATKMTTPKVVQPKVTPPKPKPKVEKPKPPKPKAEKPKPRPEPKKKAEAPKPKPKPKVAKPKVTPPKPKVETPKEAKAELKKLKDGLMAVNLADQFNSDGITDESDRTDSDFDEWKQSFPAAELPKPGTFEPEAVKTAFLFPSKAKGEKNNIACAGQTIPLEGKAKALHLLVSATDGNQEAKITVNYTDASVQKDLKVTDWCQKAAFGEKVGVASAKRVKAADTGDGLSAVDQTCSIWVVSIPLDAKRDLKSVKLPYNSLIHIFAMTLAK
jgi:hypothetical protein